MTRSVGYEVGSLLSWSKVSCRRTSFAQAIVSSMLLEKFCWPNLAPALEEGKAPCCLGSNIRAVCGIFHTSALFLTSTQGPLTYSSDCFFLIGWYNEESQNCIYSFSLNNFSSGERWVGEGLVRYKKFIRQPPLESLILSVIYF